MAKKSDQIAGYNYGHAATARSPVSLEELRQLEETVGWSEEDSEVLQRHGAIFRSHAGAMVDSWRAVIGAQPHLAKWFFDPSGKPDEQYKARVKKRFVQWVLDACFRPHDQAWLDYQEEIGLRHTPENKNKTDGAHTPPVVPLRFLLGFVTTVTIGTRKFLTNAGVAGDDLQKLEAAWAKTVHSTSPSGPDPMRKKDFGEPAGILWSRDSHNECFPCGITGCSVLPFRLRLVLFRRITPLRDARFPIRDPFYRRFHLPISSS
ncbi:MAG: hypothetical protein H0X34_13305 [Chthoniobacterales bacterium]|nr:hypothetical protein [Chthoniobacterales bacterium]